jgi:hypothetical protein
MPMQAKAMPKKPKNREAGSKVSPIRNGIHSPIASNPTDTIMHGRGRRLFTRRTRPTKNSTTGE